MRTLDSKIRTWWAGLALIALVPFGACAGAGSDADRAEELRVLGAQDGAVLVAQAEPPDAEMLFAELAAGVVSAINEGEVEVSIAPAVRASEFDVREYAERMIRDHKRANTELVTLLQEQGIRAKESTISVLLRVDATTTAIELLATPNEELDVMYMEKQVYGHAKAHALISALAVRAENEALRTYLFKQVTTIDQHLSVAIRILRELYENAEPTEPVEPTEPTEPAPT